MGEKELKTEQAILSRFQELRNELSVLSNRANELSSESQEHNLVLKALEPLDGDRKCYRVVCSSVMFGTPSIIILTHPALQLNMSGLDCSRWVRY
jgi:prefoldin subunit 2